MRLGLLSTARINAAILKAAAASDAVEAVAVGSRHAARADAYAHEHGIPRAHGSYDELLADPEVEAIYNSLPNSLHTEWTIRALDAGKHVLCEKPFDRRPDAVARAFDVADRHGLVLMEAFAFPHHPQTANLLDIVASGAIGELRNLRASFCFTLEDDSDVRMRPELDGGALMDLGCYCICGCRLLAGEPQVVFGRERQSRTGVDIAFAGLLEFAGGVHAEFHCAFDLPYETGLEVIGSAGRIVVPEPFGCRDPHLLVDGERVDVEDDDRYKLQLENFAAAVRGDEGQRLGRADAVGQATVIDALYRSAATATAVSL